MKTNFTLLKSSLMILFLCLGLSSWGQYTGIGTFTKITSVAELTDGYYVITNETDAFVMTNVRSGTATTGFFVSATITAVSGEIINPSAANVWKIETNGTGKTIYNEAIGKYVGWSSGNAASIEDSPADTNRWTFSYADSKWTVNNVATTARQLSYNSGAPRFAAYENANQHELQLYKLGETTPPTQVATPNISFSGTAVATDTYLNSTDVTLATSTTGATIYYTTDGSEPTTSSTIYTTPFSITSTTVIKAFAVADDLDDSEILTKNITIVNAPENDLCQNAIPLTVNASATNGTLQYATVSGNPFSNYKDVWYTISPTWDAPHTITLSGFSGDADLYLFDQSNSCPTTTSAIASSATTSSTETITHNLVSSKTYYVRIIAYNVAAESDFNISVTSTEPLPTITSSTPTAMTAVLGGNLVTQNITIGGTNLEGDITAVLSDNTHFSVSPSQFSFTGGTLVVTYQPTTLGTHTATVTLSSTGAQDVIINLNGTATLNAPIAIAQPIYTTSNSFVANWNPVPGAETYEIDVYTIEDLGSIPVNVVGWDFEDQNTGSDYGITDNLNRTITTNSTGSIVYNTAGDNTSLAAISSSGWDGGSGSKHWTVSFTTAGISNMKLSSIQRSSNTGPKDFKVQYSLDASNWTDVPGANITVANNFTTGVLSEVALPVECDNQTIVYLRWIMTSNTSANNGAVVVGGTSAIDNIIIDGDQGGLSIVYHLQNQNVGSATAYEVTDLNPETTYYYVVRAAVAGTETSANSNVIEVTTTIASTIVTWTGTEWINGDPSIGEDVIIEGLLTVGEDYESFEAKTLTVDTGTSIYIREGSSITVAGVIKNQAAAGNFVVESGANLVQNDDVENTGAITVYRDSQPMKRLDYTLWSSPVEGMLLKDFSEVSPSGGTGTIWNRVFTLGPTSWNQVWATQPDFQNDTTTTFTKAQGYLYRSRNDYPADEAIDFQGKFVGIPHNGTKMITTSNAYDAVGNPYPSTLDADLFLLENTGVDALYFWTNTHAPVDGSYDEVPNNWASYTYAGGTAAGSSATPNGLIATGQGFVVENSDTSVTFNNTMRTVNSGMFFKTMESEKHRLWLNLSIEDTMLNQMMVAYMDGATEGVDAQIDGKMFSYAGSALYSIITDQEDAYAIQGRSIPFTNTDVVALGFRAVQAGTYTVSLADFDGLFSDGQDIYLKDNATQTYHDLKDGAYTFVSDQGIFDSRFEVVYQADGGLSTNNPTLDNKWIVYSQDNGFQIEVQGFELKEVLVYDMLGRLVYNNQAEGTSHTISNIANGVLIVKVITTDNQVLTRKTAK